MYEDQTFDEIMERMLQRVPDDFDKREGSIIYDALAPAAVELSAAYSELDNTIANTFAKTCNREFLLQYAEERGIAPKEATPAVLKLNTSPSYVDIPLESVFTIGNFNYSITAKEQDGVYEATCETPGAEGGNITADMTPIPVVEIDDLEEVVIDGVLVNGSDEEDTESLRKRYIETLKPYAFAGNKADYTAKVMGINGVGGVKVFRAGDIIEGAILGGMVYIYILDNEFNIASDELITKVQKIIDPNPGTGEGLAPIGHTVLIRTCKYTNIDISVRLTLKSQSANTDDYYDSISSMIQGYFKELNKTWADTEALIVRRSKLEDAILSLDYITDCNITNLSVTGGQNVPYNLELDKVSLPFLDTLKIET